MTPIVIRADDAASCSEANRAIAECVDAGMVRCVSVMATGSALSEAAALLADRDDIEIGLHVTLNSEWEKFKWGPVLPYEQVPTLVDEKGEFLPMPEDLLRRGFSVEEALREVAAQLTRLRDAGFRPTYLDEHCLVSWTSQELDDALHSFAEAEGLRPVKWLPLTPASYQVRYGYEPVDGVEEGITRGVPGFDGLIWVTHPGIDEPGGVMRRFHLRGNPDDGSVARERDEERQLLCDPRLPINLRHVGVIPVTYKELYTL